MPDENIEIQPIETIVSYEPMESLKDEAKATDIESKTDEGKTFTENHVKDLRKESATYRNRAKELEKKARDAELKAAELNDTIKVSQEEAKNALNESKRLNSIFEQRVINAELKAAAMESGLVDMDAFKMVDISKVKLNKNGDVVGIKELLGDLKKNKPYLFKEITTSNKDYSAPKADQEVQQKPIYNTAKELKEAKQALFASFS